ncbi:hypothetical protein OSB04_003307 [Centaurea solstitialis]|uniref:Uncharacterized protein n=1 Tax=Centaurea solstitialis TaxID=347529 RepID=A0AA38U523_9ASTR|nr:hypothetical protein OSB04_003307 [Centaurea solstitialis]
MVADNKGKKPKLSDNIDDDEQIDSDLIHSIEKLQEVQDELEKINEKASDEVLEVEQKYNEVRKPVYEKRSDIIKSIPDFWLTAFLSHPVLSDLLNEEDQKIFKHLTSLEVEDFKDMKSGYSITFNFMPNRYFDDTKLTKAFTFLDDGTTKITATPIKWKEGMGVPNGVTHEKNGNKRPHEEDRFFPSIFFVVFINTLNSVDKKTVDLILYLKWTFWCSFFGWFSETQQKDDIEDISDEVAELIKEDLWTNPLTYFNNDADEEEFDGDEEENGSDDSEEDEGN